MKIKILLSILALGFFLSALGQNTIELNYSAIDNADYVQLDSVKVMNRSQGGDTVLYWPDTVLVLNYPLIIPEVSDDIGNLRVFQNYPNPVRDKTTISLYIPKREKVSLVVTDILGHELIQTERMLDQGYHSYQFTPGSGKLFFFTAQCRKSSHSIKILHSASANHQTASLEYLGNDHSKSQMKAMADIQSFVFNLGDELLYIGYADTLQSGMLDTPDENQGYTFQFATNIPCPGTPTVDYEGQTYNTIQVFSQCWIKENLNVGLMIPGAQDMTDNDTIEKYCYNDSPDSCAKYGGFYQWEEMMQYTMQQGSQGICPPGWHLPTDEEWKVLEGAVDSQYGIGESQWDSLYTRGLDAGRNLRTTSGWTGGNNGTDLFGFSGLPSGYREYDGGFNAYGEGCFLWSSVEAQIDYAWGRFLRNIPQDEWGVFRIECIEESGFVVRCIKNE